MQTLKELLAVGADTAVAISAPGRTGLCYAALRELCTDVQHNLLQAGFDIGARIAIVLPNGPEMATAFTSFASFASTAPLNPAYRLEEFDFYLQDLNADAVLVEQGSQSPVIKAANKLSIPVLELVIDASKPAGYFSILLKETANVVRNKSAPPRDTSATALILHTSGTTSRPKIVPLTQANVCASAGHIAETLQLSPNDVCLNLMPLFHIHGLIAAVLASLRAGASVNCTPGFNALKFFDYLAASKANWYTAVPTMHQAILARAQRNPEAVAASKLRFIRSSSASLPPTIMMQLEAIFKAPVIEAYGMTEAAHQMSSNPLPPDKRYAGTVGKAAGPRVEIMSEAGELLGSGDIGEIVIQGRNVTKGYENNPQANAENFTNGWFRTGDQGYFDDAGYLRITGRLKEIINRGGEKISPREVDEVLLDHPAVAQVVTFAIPHEKLGETVAAAVVLVENESLEAHKLRSFVADRLVKFKVPDQIIFVDEIPKGVTGKLQRIGLAKTLGLAE